MNNYIQNKIIVHVSEVNISPNGGMGRVELNWKQEFERRGYQFIHIGPQEIGNLKHPGLFPYKAFQYFKRLGIKPLLVIVHEPAGGAFVNKGFPVFIESHGLEQRNWNLSLQKKLGQENISWKTKILFPIWRLRNCNKGLKNADFLLLINQEDKDFVKLHFAVPDKKIFVFKNGAYPNEVKSVKNKVPKILFNASWIERKGIKLLVEAAAILHQKGILVQYLLMGTGKKAIEILKDWPVILHQYVEIIEKFDSNEEQEILSKADLFVLPSYYEGQPLSLLQAMAAGLCCITTDCCGQKDIITDGIDGYLFERGNLNLLVTKIEICLSNSVAMEQIGANAKITMLQRTWERTNIETVDFILSAINIQS